MKKIFPALILSTISCLKFNNDIPSMPFINPTGNEKYLSMESDYIFDQNILHDFQLIIPEISYKMINDDPTKEEYIEGALIFAGDTISPVGIRYKGSVGAFVGCTSGKNALEPSGEKICKKLSMKVKIDWNGRKNKFYNLDKLQFHSQNNDPTQLHERLGYWFFRSMGVAAPRSVHARLIINGELSGLYALTEQIDENFIRQNFDDTSGNLYKEVWPLNHKGMPSPKNSIIKALKTNKGINTNIDIFQSFAKTMSEASSSQAKEVITSFMDLEKIMSYIAVDRAIRNDDGVFHWYEFGQGASNHNYYWYEEPSKRKIHLIPWDLDNAFENLSSINEVTFIPDDFGEITNNCDSFPYGQFGFWQRSASCDAIINAWSAFDNEYVEKKKKLLNDHLDKAFLLVDEWKNQIESVTIEANKADNNSLSPNKWLRHVDILKSQLYLIKLDLSRSIED